jgi:hypothetical protein
MARAIRPRPEVEVIDGQLWPDGWTTPQLAIEVAPEPAERLVRVTVTNPWFNTTYLRNRLTVRLDGETAFDDLVFAGHGVRIERTAAAKAPLLIEVASEASLEPDPLDDRARGVWLKLEQKAVEKKT